MADVAPSVPSRTVYVFAGVLIAAGVGVFAASWNAEAGACWGGCGSLFLVFVGASLALQRWREDREARYAEHLREAIPGRAPVVHRVSIAIDAAHRTALEGSLHRSGAAHELLQALEPHVRDGLPFAHAVEPLGSSADPAGALEERAIHVGERELAEVEDAAYRVGARERTSVAGRDGLVVLSVLVAARPTSTDWPRVTTVARARALVDAILPIAPEDVLGATCVLTPADPERSFDRAALETAFPELVALSSGRDEGN